MIGDSIKKVVGVFVPTDDIDNLSGDDLRTRLQEFSEMKMEMFFKEPSTADKGKAVVEQARSQINSFESILLNIGGDKKEFRSAPAPGQEEIRALIERLRAEGLSLSEISKDYSIFGKSPLDKDIDPATMRVMAQRMNEDVARYRQARMELEGEGMKEAPDNDLSPASAAPIPGMNMRPGI